MSFAHWLSGLSASDAAALNGARLGWRARLGPVPSFDALCAALTAEAAAALRRLWQARGFAETPEAILRERYGLDAVALAELAQTLPLAALVAARPEGAEAQAWRVFAQLAPLLDSLAPKTERKGLGFFLTPPPIARQLVERLFEDDPFCECPRLYEAGTGPGVLSLRAFAEWQARLPPQADERARLVGGFVSGSRFYERHAGLAALASLSWLAVLLDEPALARLRIAHWPLRCADALALRPDASFSHAIGNPPFLGEKQSGGALREAVARAPWLAAAYRGKADYAYLFIWQNVLQLAPGGRLALLTPAYWPTADGAKPLRDALATACSALRLEKSASNIYSAPGLEACCVSARRNDGRALANGALSFRGAGPEPSLAARLERLARHGVALGELFDVRTGIQSGADRLTARTRQRFGLASPNGAGIFVLSAQEFAALAPRLSAEERALVVPLGKTPEIGPFVFAHRSAGPRLLYLDGMTPLERLPGLAAQLAPYRALLEERRECRAGRMPWWRLHWPREATAFIRASLLVPQRAPRLRAAFAPEGAFTSVDVYHLLPRAENRVPLFAWLAVLHSQAVHEWLFWRGKRKGPLLELYHTPLSALPLPRMNPETPICISLNELGETCHAFWMAAWHERKGQGGWPAHAAKCASGEDWRALQKSLDELSYAAYESCG